MSSPLDERRQRDQGAAERRDAVVRALRDLARELGPADADRRLFFLAMVAARRAEGPSSRRRFRFLRRPAIAFAAGVALFGASALGVAATGGVDEVAERVSDALHAVRDGDHKKGPPTPGPTPSAGPVDVAGQHDGDHGDAGAGGIDGSNASGTGIQHANDNASDGPANAEDRGDNRNPEAPGPASGGPPSSGTGGPASASPTATPGTGGSNASERGRDRSSPRAHEAQDQRSTP